MTQLDTPCEEYAGARDAQGYGMQWKNGRSQRTHRVRYEEVHGPIPKGMVVMHLCDNPPCRAIDHLVLGTQKQNMQDCASKGRRTSRTGEDHGMALLTKEQADQIKLRLKDPYHGIGRDLAREFNVFMSTVSLIKKGKIWNG